jgi:hypothetical protein
LCVSCVPGRRTGSCATLREVSNVCTIA